MHSELSVPLEEVVTKSFDVLVYVDRDFNIVDADLKTAEVFGYDRVELLGQPVDMLLPTDYRLNHKGFMQAFLEGNQREGRVGKSFRMITGMRQNGEEFPCYGVILKFEEPRADRAVACVLLKELSGIMRVQKSLEASERNFNHAQQLAQFGSWEYFVPQDTLFWSDEVYRIFEIDPTKHDPSYQVFLDSIHPDDRDKVDRAYNTSLKTREPYNIIHRIVVPDGRVKLVQERGQSFFSEKGDAMRTIGTVQDISEMSDQLPELTELSSLLKKNS